MHKLQNGSQVSVRPQRKPLVGLGGYFSESNDQGAPSYPGQDWFNDCTDEFLNALAAAGIEYEHGRLDHLARMISGSNFAWLSMPIGSPFPLIGDLPPTDSDAFRYVVLTDADPYNDGVLINKEVSGTAPNLVIKYTINLPESPLHGTKIEMLNTMGALLAPLENHGTVVQDSIRNFTGTLSIRNSSSGGIFIQENTEGVFSLATEPVGAFTPLTPSGVNITTAQVAYFDASTQVPTSDRVNVFSVGYVYLLRIK